MTLRADCPTRSSLLKRVRNASDEAAWSAFLDVYQPLLLSWCRGCGFQDADADDLVADVLVRLVRFLPGFDYDRSKGRFRDWLRKILRNAVHDFRRRRGLPPGTVTLPDDLAEPPDMDELADALVPHLRRAEAAFAEVRRNTSAKNWEVWERTCRGETARTVGAALGMTIGAVCMRLKRVRDQLKAVWDRLLLEEAQGDRSYGPLPE